MPTQRQLKVGEEIRHALAAVLQRDEVPWPRDFVPPLLSVSEVRISPDLRNATAFVAPVGSDDLRETLDVLNDLQGFFRHVLAKTVRLRYVPSLMFRMDTSFVYAKKIEEILADPQVRRDLHEETASDLVDESEKDQDAGFYDDKNAAKSD